MRKLAAAVALLSLVAVSCETHRSKADRLVENYAVVKIPAPDLSGITDNGKEVLNLYRFAADEVDNIYWKQNFGEKDAFLSTLADPATKLYAEINYGPWDRIDGKPFVEGYAAKPAGACFYPADMTAAEFDAFADPAKHSPYTLVQRAEDGSLKTVWYHDAYAESIDKIADYLKAAADMPPDGRLLRERQGLAGDDRQQDGPRDRPERGRGRRPVWHQGLLRRLCAPEEPGAHRGAERPLGPSSGIPGNAPRRPGAPRLRPRQRVRHLLLQRALLQRLHQRRLQGDRHQLPV